MASEQEVNRSKELLKTEKERLAIKEKQNALDSDAIGISTSLVDSIKEIQGISTKRTTFDANILSINKKVTKEILGQKSGLSDLETIDKQITKNKNLQEVAIRKAKALTSGLSKEQKDIVKEANKQSDEILKQKKIQDDILAAAARGEAIDETALKAAEQAQIDAENALAAETEKLGTIGQQAVFTKQNADELERQTELRKNELATLEKVNDSLGLSGKFLKGLSKIPGIGQAAGKAFKTVEDAAKKAAEEGGEIKNRFETATDFADALGDELVKAATDPIVIFTTLGKLLASNNQKITEFERTLSLSSSEALELAGELTIVAATTENINVTSKSLVKTFMALNEELGIASTNFTDDVLVTSTILIENVGLAAKETANLAAAAQITGGNFEDQYKSALLATRTLQEQTGVQFNNKKILEEVGQVTGQIRANLGGNIEEIAKAVTQAKLFGASLDEVANAGKALLDFEQSITSELEAELLLGKDLNLERARAAALEGDLVTLGEELAEQAGSLSEFQEMNVLQQEALASAMGMTSDQLADILFQQEVQGKTAQELRALGKDELANRLEQQSAQETLNKLVAQFTSAFADFAKILDPIVQGFTFFVQLIAEAKDLFMGLTAIALVYQGIQKVRLAITAKQKALEGATALKALGSLALEAGRSAAKIPFIGPILAAAAIASIYALGKRYLSKGDDVFSPGQNSQGYGQRMLLAPEGAIALNNKDTVIAGTKLFRGDDVVSAGAGQVNIPTAPANKEGEKTNVLLQQLITQNAKKPQISPVGLYEVQ